MVIVACIYLRFYIEVGVGTFLPTPTPSKVASDSYFTTPTPTPTPQPLVPGIHLLKPQSFKHTGIHEENKLCGGVMPFYPCKLLVAES
jgi:hypothetical protein